MNSSVQYKSSNNQGEKNLVNVYLRNYKKMAIVIQIQTPIKNIHLKKIIALKLNTNHQNLAIFANGQRIDNAVQKLIDLKDKSIIHIVQLDRTKLEKLTIFFKYNKQVLKVQTTPKTQIRSVVHYFIQPYFHKGESQVFLAYTAKPINIFKTFEDQLVENQCEILLLDFKPSKNQHFYINQSQYSKHVSTTSTKMVGMPVMGGRNPNSIKMQKQKIAQLNKSKFMTSSIQEEIDVPDLQKPQLASSGNKKISSSQDRFAAPHQENAAPVYQGFDPHHAPKNAPTFKLEQKQNHKKEILHKANPQKQAPSHDNPSIKEKDLLFMGHMTMEQTQNISAGAIQQSKQNFLKKKSLMGKENKMINHN